MEEIDYLSYLFLLITGPLDTEHFWCRIHNFIFFCRKRWQNIDG